MKRVVIILGFLLLASPAFADTFGQLTGADSYASSANVITCSIYTPASSGTVTKITSGWQHDSGTTTNIRAGIYTDVSGTPTTLVAQSSSDTSVTGSGDFDSTVSASVVGGTPYWLCVAADNANNGIKFANGASTDGTLSYSTFAYPTFVNPYVLDAAVSRQHDIQATYTPSGGGLATPTFVQACHGHWTSGTTMTSDSCTLTAGNLVVVGYFIRSGNSISQFVSFDGDGTSSYSPVHTFAGGVFNSSYNDMGVYQAIVASSGTVTVSVTTLTSGIDLGSIGILEYSNVDAMSPVDIDANFNHQNDPGTGGGFLTSSSINTTVDSDLIVSFMFSTRGGSGITYTSAAGYTKRDTYETTTGMSEDKNQTTHGAIAATATQDYSDAFTDTFTDISAFKAAASGGGGGGGSTARSLSSLGVGR